MVNHAEKVTTILVESARSNHTSVIIDMSQKILTPHAPPFKVIRTDMDRSATCDFRITYLDHTVSEINGDI